MWSPIGAITGEAREAKVDQTRYRNAIPRMGTRNHSLAACQQRRNQRIAKTRAAVERVFGAIEPDDGSHMVPHHRQVRANVAMTMTAAGYKLKPPVHLRKAGVVSSDTGSGLSGLESGRFGGGNRAMAQRDRSPRARTRVSAARRQHESALPEGRRDRVDG